jgi:hypothetical protein
MPFKISRTSIVRFAATVLGGWDPQRGQELIREYSLRVVTCDIEREHLSFEDRSVATIAFCAPFYISRHQTCTDSATLSALQPDQGSGHRNSSGAADRLEQAPNPHTNIAQNACTAANGRIPPPA